MNLGHQFLPAGSRSNAGSGTDPSAAASVNLLRASLKAATAKAAGKAASAAAASSSSSGAGPGGSGSSSGATFRQLFLRQQQLNEPSSASSDLEPPPPRAIPRFVVGPPASAFPASCAAAAAASATDRPEATARSLFTGSAAAPAAHRPRVPESFADGSTSSAGEAASLRQPATAGINRGVCIAKAKQPEEEGLLVDAEALVVGVGQTLDVFKGLIMVFMAASQVLVAMSTPTIRESSPLGLFICNSAAAHCVAGLIGAFGYACYLQYFREWPDPPPKVDVLQLMRTCFFPLICAWICGFAQRFSRPLASPSRAAAMLEVRKALIFEGTYGCGPDVLIACTTNFLLVFVLWRPITRLLGAIRPGLGRDAAALGLCLSPLLLTATEIDGCGTHRQWVRHLLPCTGENPEAEGSLPALPHLVHFAGGLLLAACWDRFYGDLRPVGDGGPSGGLHVLPWPEARHWVARAVMLSVVLMALFLPLGQVFLYSDLTSKHVATPYGRLVRAYPGGPSPLFLLSTLWPLAALAGTAGLLVAWSSGAGYFGAALRIPVGELEHLGSNMLFYVTFLNVFLAGIVQAYKGVARSDPLAFMASHCILGALAILAAGRFLTARVRGK